MNARSQVLTILLLVIGVPCLLTFHGCVDLTRWGVAATFSHASMRSDPQSYGSDPAPQGNWLVIIEGHSAVAKPLATYLKAQLPLITRGASVVGTATALPTLTSEGNVVWIKLQPSAIWSPFYARLTDRARIIVTTGSIQPGPVAEGVGRQITPGNVAIDIDYENRGQGIGLVGRAQMSAYRAKLLGDATLNVIQQVYRDLGR